MDWAGWAVFGSVDTTGLTGVMIAAQLAGRTPLDLPLMLGTMATEDPDRARVAGFAIHLAIGQVFALFYAAGVRRPRTLDCWPSATAPPPHWSRSAPTSSTAPCSDFSSRHRARHCLPDRPSAPRWAAPVATSRHRGYVPSCDNARRCRRAPISTAAARSRSGLQSLRRPQGSTPRCVNRSAPFPDVVPPTRR